MSWSAALVAMATAAAAAAAPSSALGPWAGEGARPAPPWSFEGLPGQRLPATRYSVVEEDGERVLRIESSGSYGNLVHPLHADAGTLSWRWRVERLLPDADLRSKPGDDTSVKVCALFDMPIERVPFFERQLLRLARARTDRPLPAATLCYVWDTALPAGTRLPNAFSARVRYVVLRSGPPAAPGWAAERRDLAADFRQAFGDESPQEVPPLLAIAVGADSDNTGGQSVAYVADLQYHVP